MLAPVINTGGRPSAGFSISSYSGFISFTLLLLLLYPGQALNLRCSRGSLPRVYRLQACSTSQACLFLWSIFLWPMIWPQHQHKFMFSSKNTENSSSGCQFRHSWKELFQKLFGTYSPGGWDSVLSSPSRNTLERGGAVPEGAATRSG